MADERRLVDELGRISGAIAGGDALEATLEGVLRAMGDATGAERCSILLRAGRDHLRVRAVSGLPAHVLERTPIPIGQGIAGRVAESGTALLLRDAARARGGSGSTTVYGGSSALCVPLRARGEVIGVVNLADKRDAGGALLEFDETDLKTAMVLANQAALAIGVAEAAEARAEHERLRATLASLEARVLSPETQTAALALIQQATDSIASAGTLAEILEGIVQHTTRLLGARRGSLLLREPGSRLLRMQAAVGIPAKVVEKARVELGHGIAGRCAETGEALLVRDIDELRERLPDTGERSGEYQSKSAICVPLRLRGEVLGVLNLNDRADGKELGPGDLFVAQIVASQAAVAIWNGQLREQAVAAAETHQALAVAHEIQQSLVPPDARAPGLEVAARSIACSGAGGDYVDFWPLHGAHGRETGEWVLAIGDVSGHGMGAALVMATTRAFLRGLLSQSDDPSTVLWRLNELLGRDVREGRFVTLFVGVVDAARGTLRYASAGHDPPLHRRAADGASTALEATGPPLAVLDGAEFPGRSVALAPGDWLLLTTDGVWEIRNAAGRAFGRERLAAALDELAAESPQGMLAGLRRRVAGFAGAVDPADDISLVVVRIGEVG